MKLKLKKFDMSTIPQDAVIVLTGKRRTGKSFIVRELLYHLQDMPIGIVASPTEKLNRFYADHVPKAFIHNECTSDLLQKLISRQEMIVKKMQKEERRTCKPSAIDPRAFVILDDCLYDSKWTRTKEIRYLFMNGRHAKLCTIITSQYSLGIEPALRSNIDYAIILRDNNYQNRRRLYENYASCFPSFEMFCSVMDATTENYECLVIDNTRQSNKLEDCAFWFKATEPPPFRVGADVFWDMQSQNEDSDEDCEEDFDAAKYTQKRLKGPRINIKKHD